MPDPGMSSADTQCEQYTQHCCGYSLSSRPGEQLSQRSVVHVGEGVVGHQPAGKIPWAAMKASARSTNPVTVGAFSSLCSSTKASREWSSTRAYAHS
jgi:hypothetical protein